MPVTDQQVATLRAQLAGDLEEHKRLRRQLDRTADGRAYSALVTSAFVEAVDRRFTKDTRKDDVVEFVAGVRSSSERVRDALDPRVAERLLLATIGDEDISDLDPAAVGPNRTGLLVALVADEQFDDAALDEFMASVRPAADNLLSRAT